MFSRRKGRRFNRGRVAASVLESLWIPPGFGESLAAYLPIPTSGQFWDRGSGGDLLRWHDQSGNDVQVTQPTTSMQPSFEPAGFNGRPSFYFSAAAECHLKANALAAHATGTDTPWVVSELVEVISGTGATFAFAMDSSATPMHTIQTPHVGGTNKLRSFRRNDANTSDDDSSANDYPLAAQAVIYEFDAANNQLRVYIDSVASPFTTLAVTLAGAVTLDNCTLGAQNPGDVLARPLEHRKRTFLMWSGIGSLEAIAAGARAEVMAKMVEQGGITP